MKLYSAWRSLCILVLSLACVYFSATGYRIDWIYLILGLIGASYGGITLWEKIQEFRKED